MSYIWPHAETIIVLFMLFLAGDFIISILASVAPNKFATSPAGLAYFYSL